MGRDEHEADLRADIDRLLLRLVLLVVQVREWDGLDHFEGFGAAFVEQLEDCVRDLERVKITDRSGRATRVRHLRALAVHEELTSLLRDVQLSQPAVALLGAPEETATIRPRPTKLKEAHVVKPFRASFDLLVSFLVDAFTDDGFEMTEERVEEALTKRMMEADLDSREHDVAEWIRAERGPAEAAQRLMSKLGVGDRQRMVRLRKTEADEKIKPPPSAHRVLGPLAVEHVRRLVMRDLQRLGYDPFEQFGRIAHGDQNVDEDDSGGHGSQ